MATYNLRLADMKTRYLEKNVNTETHLMSYIYILFFKLMAWAICMPLIIRISVCHLLPKLVVLSLAAKYIVIATRNMCH